MEKKSLWLLCAKNTNTMVCELAHRYLSTLPHGMRHGKFWVRQFSARAQDYWVTPYTCGLGFSCRTITKHMCSDKYWDSKGIIHHILDCRESECPNGEHVCMSDCTKIRCSIHEECYNKICLLSWLLNNLSWIYQWALWTMTPFLVHTHIGILWEGGYVVLLCSGHFQTCRPWKRGLSTGNSG